MKSTSQPRVLIAFIALALLAGPVSGFISSPMGLGGAWLGPLWTAAASGLAGLLLLVLALARRESLPRGAGLLALLALSLPPWLDGLLSAGITRSVHLLHETPWGVALLVSLAAPLWLALLSALQLVRDEVPRAVAGASIAGIGAVTLMIPEAAYTPALNQIPVAALHILLAVLAVLSWSYARPRLAANSTAATAGCFLLLTALGQAALLPLTARDLPSSLSLREAALPLLLTTAVSAASWLLWFWLLERMSLAAFSLRALAAWTAAILPGFLMMGFLSWRVDAAVTISLAALVTALRARAADEQPLALGLADS